jgi:hypothetical protein
MKTLMLALLIILTLISCGTVAWKYRKVTETCTAYLVVGKPYKSVITETEMHESSWQWEIYTKISNLINRKVSNKKRISGKLRFDDFEHRGLIIKFARALEDGKNNDITLIQYPNYMEMDDVTNTFSRLSFAAVVPFRVKYYLLVIGDEGKTINCVIGDDENDNLCILSYRDENDKIVNSIIR